MWTLAWLNILAAANKDSKTLEGNPAVTIFAPTNDAFKHLPFRLKLFLFSPLGHRALKKILSYHVVPDFILHTSMYMLN